jgi:hypothetical protein
MNANANKYDTSMLSAASITSSEDTQVDSLGVEEIHIFNKKNKHWRFQRDV